MTANTEHDQFRLALMRKLAAQGKTPEKIRAALKAMQTKRNERESSGTINSRIRRRP